MTVFVWKDPCRNYAYNDAWSDDEKSTSWAIRPTCCMFCGEPMSEGDKSFMWHCTSGGFLVAHAACIKKNAVGLLKDIGECLR